LVGGLASARGLYPGSEPHDSNRTRKCEKRGGLPFRRGILAATLPLAEECCIPKTIDSHHLLETEVRPILTTFAREFGIGASKE
jgi:hypothetical protein